MDISDQIKSAVAQYGNAVRNKLAAINITGQPEDQLRAPLETLVRDLCELSGRNGSKLTLIGETSLATLSVRPDYAVEYDQQLIGFIEVKAPGKGADPRRFRDMHDKAQWKKLAALPNLLYTDGQDLAIWRDGEPFGSTISFVGEIEQAGSVSSSQESVAVHRGLFCVATHRTSVARSLGEHVGSAVSAAS